MPSTLNIRPASLAASDQDLILDLWDSQLSWLSTVGSGDQWGSRPIREARPDAPGRTLAWVQKSEAAHEWGSDWCRAWVAEALPAEVSTMDETEGQSQRSIAGATPAAALVLESKSASYVRSILPEQDRSEPFVYLSYLMSNRAAGELSKGAGSSLIKFAKEQTQKLGLHRLCVDCYRGNDRKLVSYYESQGFVLVQDFTVSEKEWPGSVLEMRF